MAAGRNQTRIAKIMIVTAILAIVMASPQYIDQPLVWLALIAFAFALPWIVTPAALRRNVWQPVDLDFRPFDPAGADVAGEVGPRLDAAAADLLALGFVLRGFFRQGRPASHGLVSHLGLFERPSTWEVAKVMVNTHIRGVQTTLLFQTTLATGVEVATSDSGELPPWPRREDVVGTAFPEIRSTVELFEVHRAVVARQGGRAVRELPASDEALVGHLRTTMDKNRAWPVALGLYEIDEDRGVFRMTWMGAFRNAWGRLKPVGPIRKALRRRRGRQTLRELVHEGWLAEGMVRV